MSLTGIISGIFGKKNDEENKIEGVKAFKTAQSGFEELVDSAYSMREIMEARINNPVAKNKTNLWDTYLSSKTMILYGGFNEDGMPRFKIDHSFDLSKIINANLLDNCVISIDKETYLKSEGTEFIIMYGDSWAIRADKYASAKKILDSAWHKTCELAEKVGGFRIGPLFNCGIEKDEVCKSDGWKEFAVGKNKATAEDYKKAGKLLKKYVSEAKKRNGFKKSDSGKWYGGMEIEIYPKFTEIGYRGRDFTDEFRLIPCSIGDSSPNHQIYSRSWCAVEGFIKPGLFIIRSEMQKNNKKQEDDSAYITTAPVLASGTMLPSEKLQMNSYIDKVVKAIEQYIVLEKKERNDKEQKEIERDYQKFSKKLNACLGEIRGYKEEWEYNLHSSERLIDSFFAGMANKTKRLDNLNNAKRDAKDNLGYAFGLGQAIQCTELLDSIRRYKWVTQNAINANESLKQDYVGDLNLAIGYFNDICDKLDCDSANAEEIRESMMELRNGNFIMGKARSYFNRIYNQIEELREKAEDEEWKSPGINQEINKFYDCMKGADRTFIKIKGYNDSLECSPKKNMLQKIPLIGRMF